MASVKIVVTALGRYWAAGRCWEAGVTEAVLEDLPGLPIEAQLAQLDAAKGGSVLQQNGLDRSNPEQRGPCLLTYRIVVDAPPAPLAAPALEMTAGPGEPPAYEPEQEAPAETPPLADLATPKDPVGMAQS